MKIKKVISFAILFALIFIQMFSVTKISYATGENRPILQIENTEIPEGIAGRNIIIPLTVKNYSNFYAKDVEITPIFDQQDSPYIIDQLNNVKVIKKIAPDKKESIEYKFRLDRNAKAKIYPLKFKITYKNSYDNRFEKEIMLYVKVTQVQLPTKLVVDDVKIMPQTAVAGEEVAVDVFIKNMGTIEAKDIKVLLVENENFAVKDSITQKIIYKLPGMISEKVQFKLVPKETLSTDTYKINIKINYINNNDEKTEVEQGIYIPIQSKEGNGDKANLKIENINAPKNAVKSQEKFKTVFNIVNSGKGIAKNVKISMMSDDENIYPVSQSKFVLGDIATNTSIPVEFVFSSTDEIKTKNYPLKVVLEYDQKENDKVVTQTIEQYVGVLINGKNGSSAGTIPKIIIDKYSSEPGIVHAGENFKLNMTFLNTSKEKSVRNMKITLQAKETTNEEGSVFSPVQCSNTFYIDYLAPQEKVQKQMVLYTIPNALAKTYTIETVFEYEYDNEGKVTSNKMSDDIGIHVVQPAKLEVSDLMLPPEVYVNEPAPISIELYNMGKVKLNNLMVKAQGDFNIRDGNYFVGNFDIGGSDYYEASIIAKEPGQKKGKVILSFEDPTGKTQTIEKEFTINVMEGAPPDKMGIEPQMPQKQNIEKKNNKSKKIYIPIAVGAILLIILIVVIRKIRKKKKGMTFDEDF